MFSGVEKGCIGNKWVKESAKLRLLLGFMSCVGRVSRVGCVGQYIFGMDLQFGVSWRGSNI